MDGLRRPFVGKKRPSEESEPRPDSPLNRSTRTSPSPAANGSSDSLASRWSDELKTGRRCVEIRVDELTSQLARPDHLGPARGDEALEAIIAGRGRLPDAPGRLGEPVARSRRQATRQSSTAVSLHLASRVRRRGCVRADAAAGRAQTTSNVSLTTSSHFPSSLARRRPAPAVLLLRFLRRPAACRRRRGRIARRRSTPLRRPGSSRPRRSTCRPARRSCVRPRSHASTRPTRRSTRRRSSFCRRRRSVGASAACRRRSTARSAASRSGAASRCRSSAPRSRRRRARASRRRQRRRPTRSARRTRTARRLCAS